MAQVEQFVRDALSIVRVPSQSCCFALVGTRGDGRSYCIGQLCDRLLGCGYVLSSVSDSLTYNDETVTTEGHVVIVDYFALIADLEACPSFGCKGSTFAPDTVVVIDNVELLDSLCQINGKTHLLKRLARLLWDSVGCVLIVCAEDENNIPFYFVESHSPTVFKLSSFTEEEMRQLGQRTTDRATPTAVMGDFSTSFREDTQLCRRSVVAAVALCLGGTKSQCEGSPADTRALLSDALVSFVGSKGDVSAVTQRVHLYGLQPLVERLRVLVQVFVNLRQEKGAQQLVSKSVSTTGILLHGPSGCGKTALAQQLALEFPKIHFSFVNCTTLFSKYLGESEEKLRAVYQAARAKTPSVVVLDEVDVIAPSRGSLNEASGGKQEWT
ncbi:ATPase domain protein [Strigomonas culicis]|uniref:ATPase domain protein n=1 Tax=Strigomonas culicis TaxID=28005 RepID=S9TLX1_9TRYP|nr:ATPase domain protein [Strigomonas culicis]|eukprot:EPY19212.1 ATPase domain protein [Strigomonas culicis]